MKSSNWNITNCLASGPMLAGVGGCHGLRYLKIAEDQGARFNFCHSTGGGMSGKHHGSAKADSSSSSNPNASMRMSGEARLKMLGTERIVMRYYNDLGKKRGNCTWGPGFLAHKGICSEEELALKVSAPSIDIEYAKRVSEAERMVKRKVKVALSQAQFDALCSLTYNAGPTNASDVYRYINQGNFGGAADTISKMIKVQVTEHGKKKLVLAPGLIRRREEESAPFRVVQNAATTSD